MQVSERGHSGRQGADGGGRTAAFVMEVDAKPSQAGQASRTASPMWISRYWSQRVGSERGEDGGFDFRALRESRSRCSVRRLRSACRPGRRESAAGRFPPAPPEWSASDRDDGCGRNRPRRESRTGRRVGRLGMGSSMNGMALLHVPGGSFPGMAGRNYAIVRPTAGAIMRNSSINLAKTARERATARRRKKPCPDRGALRSAGRRPRLRATPGPWAGPCRAAPCHATDRKSWAGAKAS